MIVSESNGRIKIDQTIEKIDSEGIKTRLDEIFYKTLIPWNKMFSDFKSEEITEREIRSYTLKEREFFVKEVGTIIESLAAQVNEQKEALLRVAREVVKD